MGKGLVLVYTVARLDPYSSKDSQLFIVLYINIYIFYTVPVFAVSVSIDFLSVHFIQYLW
jgi:hypothetical protein